jgi:Flp pilus assembly protein TadD
MCVRPLTASAGDRSTEAPAYLDRCVKEYVKGNLSGAIGQLREALRLNPQNGQLLFMLGNALYRSEDFAGAARAYRSSLAVRPRFLEGHMSLGFTLFALKEFRQATAEWLAAVCLNSREPFARAALAIGLYSLGDLENARIQYALAQDMDSRYIDPDNLRVDIRWTQAARDMAFVLARSTRMGH